MNRSSDWLHQARADLDLAAVSAEAGHHEWACFACHQAVEKALKALHLAHGQQVWGHGLGRSYRELPRAVAERLAAAVGDLDDRLRILDTSTSPRAIPIACRMGPPLTISAVCKAPTPSAMPVRLLTQSLLRWPEANEVREQVRRWAATLGDQRPGLRRVGVFGSYGRGDAGVGSDLDLLLVDARACGLQRERLAELPLEELPLSCDALVLTPAEHDQLLAGDSRMARELDRDTRWLWQRAGDDA